MPALSFLIPAGADGIARTALMENLALCSGPSGDAFPELTIRSLEGNILMARSEGTESCHVLAPWSIPGKGTVLLKSATLIAEYSPFRLLVELARGKIHQVSSIVSDMSYRGLRIGHEAPALISKANQSFAMALSASTDEEANNLAHESIRLSSEAAEAYLADYQAHLMGLKAQSAANTGTVFSFTLRGVLPNPDQTAILRSAFTGVSISLPWAKLQPAKGAINWEPLDSSLAWARSHGFSVTIGPILSPDAGLVPSWLSDSRQDVNQVAGHIARYVDQILKRYCGMGFNGRFNIINSGNVSHFGDFSEDEMLRLSWHALDAAKQVDCRNEITMGIRQPWGEIMGVEAREHNPANYLDTLVRSVGIISAIELETLSGSIVGSTHPKDMLDYHRLPELYYGISQKPMKVVLAFPANHSDTFAVSKQSGDIAFDERVFRLGSIYAASPYVNEVRWHQIFDDDPGGVPGAGLFNIDGKPNRVLHSFVRLGKGLKP